MVAQNDKGSVRYRQFAGGYAQVLDSQLKAVLTGYQRGLLRRNEVRVYDYADLNVAMLARMFDRRCRGYEGVGYRILLPASAAPGWPVEVPLPVDPQWKNEYAATVRRLVRDGVDAPLANLFVHAARDVSPHAEGINRAQRN